MTATARPQVGRLAEAGRLRSLPAGPQRAFRLRPTWSTGAWLVALVCAWSVLDVRGRAQPAVLDLHVCAGLTITGIVGNVYSVGYVTNRAQTNNAGAWRCLEYVALPTSPFFWADTSAGGSNRRQYRAVRVEPPTNMVFIPPGTFRMGSPTNEPGRLDWEGPQTAVTITRGFWISRYEVRQGEYLAVMGSNPSRFSAAHGYAEDLSRPVEMVSWHDANRYCAAITERGRAAGSIEGNSVYRLPTEAEWEYACRAWTSTSFSYGDDPAYARLTNHAWYAYTSYGSTRSVGQKLPNAWGLHDMHGNVLEWCQDWWSGRLPGGGVVDPQGPSAGTFRVIRGGFYFSEPWDCRSAYRLMSPIPASGSSSIGFRVVLAAGPP